jgi:alkylation response protein AidB-like acyl-CoA dehydrogenase
MAAEPELANRGGGWLLEAPTSIYSPEDFDDATRELAKITRQFVERDVLPKIERMEAGALELNVPLMERAGELGALSVEIPEEYGGLDLPKVVSAVVTEELAAAGGFAVTMTAHTSIGTLPLVYFGTGEQKRRYLPKLASGEWIAAYALTEANSGSDALAARTRATLSDDRTHYLLNGTKQFISNAGFANLFTVFAQVDGEQFTAFLVERDFPGVSFGNEEQKMGIKSSSTRQVILQNAEVPRENVLGEIGKGHRIAFNVLNVGRFKLGASSVGGAKRALEQSTRYALERKQFDQPIATFGLIQQKLARMATRLFASESAVYRTIGLIDAAIAGRSGADAALNGIQEYLIECSILKVLGTEMLDYVLDEGVQIHGGYGYLHDFPIERAYRDSRIQRIFEGTNEINRLLIPDMLLRRAMKGDLPLIAAANRLRGELLEPSFERAEGEWALERAEVSNLKKLALFVAGLAVERFGRALEREQEVLAAIANIVIEAFAAESALLRAMQVESPVASTMARVYLDSAQETGLREATYGLSRLASGDDLRTYLSIARRLTRREPFDIVGAEREIAANVIESRGYPTFVPK